MAIRFEWKLSYQDICEYRAYGSTSIRSIEVYRGQSHMLEYIGSHYNGTKEQFAADILARQNGCKITYREGFNDYPYRWSQSEYAEFVEYLRAKHAEDVRITEKYQAEYPDVKFDAIPPFVAPRPIYWNQEAKTWFEETFPADSWTAEKFDAEVRP
jgi:hypothetical protein